MDASSTEHSLANISCGNNSNFWRFQPNPRNKVKIQMKILLGLIEQKRECQWLTMGKGSSGTELDVVKTGDGDAFSSVGGLSSGRNILSGLTPAADETGDGLPFCVFESVEPSVSEPTADNTDVGDWFSCSEAEKFGDTDLTGGSRTEIPFLSGCTSLRG